MKLQLGRPVHLLVNNQAPKLQLYTRNSSASLVILQTPYLQIGTASHLIRFSFLFLGSNDSGSKGNIASALTKK
jgi:hypothetical protein